MERVLYARRAQVAGDWIIECSSGLVYRRLRGTVYTVTLHSGAIRRVSLNSKALIRELELAIKEAQARVINLELEITETQKAKNTV